MINLHEDQHHFHIGASYCLYAIDLIIVLVYLVIPNVLLGSANPGDKDPDIHKIRAREIVNAGVQVVVNLMTIKEFKRLTTYADIMLQYAKECKLD